MTYVKLIPPARSGFGQGLGQNFIPRLRHSTGTPIERCVFETNSMCANGEATTAVGRFGHDFSRIPVSGPHRAIAGSQKEIPNRSEFMSYSGRDACPAFAETKAHLPAVALPSLDFARIPNKARSIIDTANPWRAGGVSASASASSPALPAAAVSRCIT